MRYDGVQWAGRDLRGATLAGASLRGANLRGCRLDDADLRDAHLWGANLALTSMRRANLRGAHLGFASFAGADLRCARLPFDLSYCDLGGAHVACADFDRPRRDPAHLWARRRGYPSFADALGSPWEARGMRPGPVLLAIDAALESAADADAELTALLGEPDTALFAVGAMAVARRAHLGRTADALWARLDRRHEGPAAAVALIRGGTPIADVWARFAASTGEGGAVDPARANSHRAIVERHLQTIAAWPHPSDQPPPLQT